jgi:hypothetical protein
VALVGLLAVLVGCVTRADAPAGERGQAGASTDGTAKSAPAASSAPQPIEPSPACTESTSAAGPWPRASEPVRVVPGAAGRGAHLAQGFVPSGSARRLRFLGTHLFDLVDKLEHEGGSPEERRRLACAALDSAAATGAPVVRLWGSLKRTGDSAEVAATVRALELVLDENARRRRPLRLVIALLNHQAGYGTPRPDASLDDQDPATGWNARNLYLEEGWRGAGKGQLEERIGAIGSSDVLRSSPYVLGWELVNELDTHRHVAGGTWTGPQPSALRQRFLVPALELLAQATTQPVAFGELRGAATPAYAEMSRELVRSLSPATRDRLVWTTHVYLPLGADPARHTAKLDLDLDLAAELGLPLFVGELGQRVPGPSRGYCRDGARHDLPQLFGAVLAPSARAPRREAIDLVAFWGEGRCGLEVRHPDRVQRVSVGAGGDTADLGPGEKEARAFLREQRSAPRFAIED